MNWAILGTIFCILTVVVALVLRADLQKEIRQVCNALGFACLILSCAFLVPCIYTSVTMNKRYYNYLELKEQISGEADSTEKDSALIDKVAEYNKWYKENKKKLKDPWEIESCYHFSNQFKELIY